MNKAILYVILTLAFVASVGLAVNTFKKPTIDVSTTKLVDNSIFKNRCQELGIKHDHALKAVQQDFNISDSVWNTHMKDFHAFVKADNLLGSGNSDIQSNDPEIVAYTKKALVEYCINPENVNIELVSNGSAFCAMQKLAKDTMNYSADNRIIHSIQLDLEKISKYSIDVQHAFVRHEIMHLLHYDSIEGAYVLTLLTELGHTSEEYNKKQSMIDYRFARELRADLLATCHDTAMAQELDKYFQNVLVNKPNDISSHSHPPYKMRHEQLAQLLSGQPQLV